MTEIYTTLALSLAMLGVVFGDAVLVFMAVTLVVIGSSYSVMMARVDRSIDQDSDRFSI